MSEYGDDDDDDGDDDDGDDDDDDGDDDDGDLGLRAALARIAAFSIVGLKPRRRGAGFPAARWPSTPPPMPPAARRPRTPSTPPAARARRARGSGSPVAVVDRRRRRSPSSLPLRQWPLPDPLRGAVALLIIIDAPHPVHERLMVCRHLEAFLGTMHALEAFLVLTTGSRVLRDQLQWYIRVVKENPPSVQRRRRRRRRQEG